MLSLCISSLTFKKTHLRKKKTNPQIWEKNAKKLSKKHHLQVTVFFPTPISGGKIHPICNWFLGPPWYQWTGKMASSCAPPRLIRKGTDKGDLSWGHGHEWLFRPCSPEIFSKKTSFDKISQIKFLDLLIWDAMLDCVFEVFWCFFFDYRFM